jgi:hypothetical protein
MTAAVGFPTFVRIRIGTFARLKGREVMEVASFD